MKILLVAATKMELEHLEKLGIKDSSHQFKLAVGGVGLVATTYAIMKEISWSAPDLIIQAGIAGSFTPLIPTGAAVVVEKEIVADLGVYEKSVYQDIFQMRLVEKNTLPYQEGCLVNPHTTLIEKTSLLRVSAVSVNEITTDEKRRSLFLNSYHADIETMEGAALHHVCILQQIPFVQIRGISNRVGERNKENWKINEAMLAVSSAFTQLTNNL